MKACTHTAYTHTQTYTHSHAYTHTHTNTCTHSYVHTGAHRYVQTFTCAEHTVGSPAVRSEGVVLLAHNVARPLRDNMAAMLLLHVANPSTPAQQRTMIMYSEGGGVDRCTRMCRTSSTYRLEEDDSRDTCERGASQEACNQQLQSGHLF